MRHEKINGNAQELRIIKKEQGSDFCWLCYAFAKDLVRDTVKATTLLKTASLRHARHVQPRRLAMSKAVVRQTWYHKQALSAYPEGPVKSTDSTPSPRHPPTPSALNQLCFEHPFSPSLHYTLTHQPSSSLAPSHTRTKGDKKGHSPHAPPCKIYT